MSTGTGVLNWRISDTPIAVVDFETTGLSAGTDRVIEVSVVRLDPGQTPRLALDTLVNPQRPVAATEIHGITDADVADAPVFQDIAGDVVDALHGCVVASYNVYFDIKFLEYELRAAGIKDTPPHICVMYMRPLLGIGPRCRLDVACKQSDVQFEPHHVAAGDALATGDLLLRYLDVARTNNIETFEDLRRRKSYKFLSSLRNAPLPPARALGLSRTGRFCSRRAPALAKPIDDGRRAIIEYWDALCSALADLVISADELDEIMRIRREHQLHREVVRALHAKAFASVISQFCNDRRLDDREAQKLNRLHACLSRLGWAPGE